MSAEPLEILMKKIRDLILENGHWAPIDEIEELVKTYGEQCANRDSPCAVCVHDFEYDDDLDEEGDPS